MIRCVLFMLICKLHALSHLKQSEDGSKNGGLVAQVFLESFQVVHFLMSS